MSSSVNINDDCREIIIPDIVLDDEEEIDVEP